jgi:hypothetical protein
MSRVRTNYKIIFTDASMRVKRDLSIRGRIGSYDAIVRSVFRLDAKSVGNVVLFVCLQFL